MKRSFLSNLVFLLFLNFLVKPFWILGIDRSVQNSVGPEDYGIYFSLFNFSMLFQVILDFGINNFNNRQIALKPERLGNYFITTLASKFAFAVAYAVVVWLVAIGIGYDQDHLGILLLLILNQVAMSYLAFIRSNVSALHLFRTDAILSVSDKVITILVCGLLLWTEVIPTELSIPVFIIIQLGGNLITGGAGTLVLLSRGIQWTKKVNTSLMKGIVARSAPFALLTFLMAAYYRIDGVMLERMLGREGDLQAGIYASAFRILDALNILGYMFGAILLPTISNLWGKGADLSGLFRTGMLAMLAISIPSGVILICHRDALMELLYIAYTPVYGEVFGWLMAGFVLISGVYIMVTTLTGAGKLKPLNIISAVGLLVNVVLNLILIPRYLALGAAIATVSTQALILVLHVLIIKKHLNILTPVSFFVRIGTYAFLVGAVVWLSNTLFSDYRISIIAAMVASVVLAVVMQMIRPADLVSAAE
jgi:O-antigen/teichoic acid export membrane protein